MGHKKVLILTLGFEEKFALRAIMRARLATGDKIITMIPSGADERTKRAFNTLAEFCRKALDVEPELHEIPVDESLKAVATIYSVLSREISEGRKPHLNLSGGMRALILETLAAALAIPIRIPIEVEVELENLMGVVEFQLNHFRLSALAPDGLRILSFVDKLRKSSEEATLNRLEGGTGISRSTLYRRLKELVNDGYLVEERHGREIRYSLTDLGRLLIAVSADQYGISKLPRENRRKNRSTPSSSKNTVKAGVEVQGGCLSER